MDEPTSNVPGQLSPDRNFYWDGRAWIPTISPDGMYRWDGDRWAAERPHQERLRAGPRSLWFVLLMVALAVLALAGGCTAYTVQYSSTCTSGGCQDIWLLWIFIVPPVALGGIATLIASLVIWRKQRAK